MASTLILLNVFVVEDELLPSERCFFSQSAPQKREDLVFLLPLEVTSCFSNFCSCWRITTDVGESLLDSVLRRYIITAVDKGSDS